MKYTEYNEDAGRNEFGAHLESESRKYSALQSLLAGKLLDKEEVDSLREFKVVQQFLDSPVGDASEAKLKKAFAASVIMAQEQGTLPFSLVDKSPIAIASAIDEGLNRVKFSYKLSHEELDVVEVADKLIDATVARVITVADKVIERGVPVILNKLSQVIAKVYPPATVFVPVIKAAEKYLVPMAKVAVRKGMSVVAKAAKSLVRSSVKGIVKVGRKLASLIGV